MIIADLFREHLVTAGGLHLEDFDVRQGSGFGAGTGAGTGFDTGFGAGTGWGTG
jgi:hypothetical protein